MVNIKKDQKKRNKAIKFLRFHHIIWISKDKIKIMGLHSNIICFTSVLCIFDSFMDLQNHTKTDEIHCIDIQLLGEVQNDVTDRKFALAL